MASTHSYSVDDLTARRGTLRILKKFDKLIKDTKYNASQPKFEFDHAKVAKNMVDTHIDEATKVEKERVAS